MAEIKKSTGNVARAQGGAVKVPAAAAAAKTSLQRKANVADQTALSTPSPVVTPGMALGAKSTKPADLGTAKSQAKQPEPAKMAAAPEAPKAMPSKDSAPKDAAPKGIAPEKPVAVAAKSVEPTRSAEPAKPVEPAAKAPVSQSPVSQTPVSHTSGSQSSAPRRVGRPRKNSEAASSAAASSVPATSVPAKSVTAQPVATPPQAETPKSQPPVSKPPVVASVASKPAAPVQASAPTSAKPEVPAAKDVTVDQPARALAELPRAASPASNELTPVPPVASIKDTTMEMSANFSGFQNAMTEAQAKAQAAFEKSSNMLGEASNFAKGNVEAMIQSTKIFADGCQELSSTMVAESRTAFENMTGDMKELAAAKSPADFLKVQSEMVRKNFDSAVAYGSKNSEAMLKLMSDMMAPISGRVSVAVEKVRQPAAAV